MVIIERTMAGMYKVLDGWIKEVLPVLPDQSLQESLLHLLQEQDDVLIEGLLCLLDTHMALYIPGKKEPETVGFSYIFKSSFMNHDGHVTCVSYVNRLFVSYLVHFTASFCFDIVNNKEYFKIKYYILTLIS